MSALDYLLLGLIALAALLALRFVRKSRKNGRCLSLIHISEPTRLGML